jgi:hypothetical protein
MLDARVEAILNGARNRKGVSRADILKIALLGSVAVAVIALARPVLAEAPKPQSTAAKTTAKHAVREGHATRTTIIKDDNGHVQVAVSDDADVPDAPEPPEAPVAPDVTPVPAAPAAPAAPPAPPAPSAKAPHHIAFHWKNGGDSKSWTWDVKDLDAQTRADIQRAAAEMKADQARAEAEQRAEIERAKGLAKAEQLRLVAEHEGEIRRAAEEAKRQIAEAQRQMREAMREASDAMRQKIAEQQRDAAEKRRDAEEARREAARDRADAARERAEDARQDAEERRRDKQQSYNVPDVKRIVRDAMAKANVPVKVAEAVSAAMPAIAVNVSSQKNGVDVRLHLDD